MVRNCKDTGEVLCEDVDLTGEIGVVGDDAKTLARIFNEGTEGEFGKGFFFPPPPSGYLCANHLDVDGPPLPEARLCEERVRQPQDSPWP